jgi:hypothetical protein
MPTYTAKTPKRPPGEPDNPARIAAHWPQAKSELWAYARYLGMRGNDVLAGHLHMALRLADAWARQQVPTLDDGAQETRARN